MDRAVDQVVGVEACWDDGADIGFGEEAFGLAVAHHIAGDAEKARFELLALAGAVVDIVAGVDAEEEAAAGTHEFASVPEGGQRGAPGQVVQREAGDHGVERRRAERERAQIGEHVADRGSPGRGWRATAVAGGDLEPFGGEKDRVEAGAAASVEHPQSRLPKPREEGMEPAFGGGRVHIRIMRPGGADVKTGPDRPGIGDESPGHQRYREAVGWRR